MSKYLLLVYSIIFYFNIFSQGYQVNFQGQKQQGMASAGTALPQDASTIFFNPGALSYLKQNEINAAITPTFSSILFEEQGTNLNAATNSPVGTPFSFYANFKKKDESKFSFGLGIYTPFGSTVQWEDGWMGRYAMMRLQLKAIFFQPTISFKITDKLGIGAGFIYSSGNVNLQKNIPVLDGDGNDGLAELSGKANGYGFNAGIYYAVNKKLSFGLTYRSKVNMAIDNGTATFTVPTSLDANFPDGKFSSSLPLPQILTLGAAYSINEKMSLAFDVNSVGWSAYDTLGFDYELNTESLVDTKSARMYKNAVAFRLGGQYKIKEQFTARLGLAYGITPVQNGYVTPETPDANRLIYTAGISVKWGSHFNIDASFLYTHLERIDTNLETNLSGKFTTNVIAPGLSISYLFKR